MMNATMKNICLALALALIAIPVGALADGSTSTAVPQAGPPGMTPAQRAATFKTMQTFGAKEKQLHQAMRAQILGDLSPEHRTAVANAIGQLAIADTPDPVAAAKQIDGLLTPGERHSILATQTSFATQRRALGQQMWAALKSEMPAHPQGPGHGPMGAAPAQREGGTATMADAGTALLMVLTHPHGEGMGRMMDHRFGMPEGPPPPGP